MRDKRREPPLPHAEPRIAILYDGLPLKKSWPASPSLSINFGAGLEPSAATLSKQPMT